MLCLICQQIWKTQQWPQDWKRSVFIPFPKKGSAKECSNYWISALISHASTFMLKILQARFREYVNWKIPDVQVGFRKGRETRDQIISICWIIEKAREFQKNIYLCFIDCAKNFHHVDHNKLWKLLKRWECQILLSVSWETSMWVKKEQLEPYRTTDWFKIEKGVRLFIVIVWNARLDESQAGIKIAERNTSNLRYAGTTLMAESEEKLKSPLIWWRAEWKSWLKTEY